MWMGETDAAIKALETAQRIDPEMNAMDRFALSLAYYLKGRYDAAIEQAEINLRGRRRELQPERAGGGLRAEQPDRGCRARRTMIHRMDPTFDPRTFGTKFLKPADLEHLREGLRKAGLYRRAPAAVARERPMILRKHRAIWFASAIFVDRSCWNRAGPIGADLPKT